MPNYGVVYFVMKAGQVDQLVIAVEGLGMWGTIYGFLSLDRDAVTVRGLTYYEHKETPGLGGEIGNPVWQALWRGRKAFDEAWCACHHRDQGQRGPARNRSVCGSTALRARRSPATRSRT